MGQGAFDSIEESCRRAKEASRHLALALPESRNRALAFAAEEVAAAEGEILEANASDMEQARREGIGGALLDRLRLNPRRVAAMVAGLNELASQPDPLGRVAEGWVRPNGLAVRRVRVPLGVVGVIYEARPNVTADAAGICIRSGNALVLRGSSYAFGSNRAIAQAIRRGLERAGLPGDCVVLLEDTSREGAVVFMRQAGYLDCLVPRGGSSLLRTVAEEARVPVVLDGEGNCHTYVDASADLEMALRVVENAKCSRPGVCNATETLLVHEAVAPEFLPRIDQVLQGVELRGDERTLALVPRAKPASESDWEREFLDLILAVRVVDSVDEAIAHIARYGTGHSEAIITQSVESWRRFSTEVDAAAVLLNTSTRFVDGGELGFGAEIGISTQKLHWRGPMGPEALTCLKLVIEGTGQVRG